MSPPIPSSWPGLTRPSRKAQVIRSHNWIAGSGPAITGERKIREYLRGFFCGREHPGNQDAECFGHAPLIGPLPSRQVLTQHDLVNRSFAAPGVNTKTVNRSLPELFPVTHMLNKHFIPAAITSHRACFLAGSKSDKVLIIKDYPSPVTSH
jgi:hypothetical protein